MVPDGNISELSAQALTGAAVAATADDALAAAPSPHAPGKCHNCHGDLAGPYCHACGQKAGHLHRPIWELAEDFLHTIVHWDGRLWTTLRTMLLHPARHVNDWINGRQMRHVPPIRLFVFISLLLLVMLNFTDVVFWRLVNTPPTAAQLAARAANRDAVLDCILKAVDPVPATDIEACPKMQSGRGLSLKGHFLTLDSPADDLDVDLIDMDDVSVSGGASADKARSTLMNLNSMLRHPRAFNEAIGRSLTKFLLIAVPVHALILKLVYIRRKRFLMEHVVFSLQSHTVLFLLLLLCVVLAWASRGLIDGDMLIGALLLVYSVHLFAAMKQFYGQGIVRSSLKFLLVGGLYLLVMAGVGTALMVRAMGALDDGGVKITRPH